MNRAWLKIVLFVPLAVLTAGTGRFMERYQDRGPEVLVNQAFNEGLQGWQIRGRWR